MSWTRALRRVWHRWTHHNGDPFWLDAGVWRCACGAEMGRTVTGVWRPEVANRQAREVTRRRAFDEACQRTLDDAYQRGQDAAIRADRDARAAAMGPHARLVPWRRKTV